MTDPVVTISGGPPAYNLDKLYEEKGQIEESLESLEDTYLAAKTRCQERLEENARNIASCHDILKAHGVGK